MERYFLQSKGSQNSWSSEDPNPSALIAQIHYLISIKISCLLSKDQKSAAASTHLTKFCVEEQQCGRALTLQGGRGQHRTQGSQPGLPWGAVPEKSQLSTISISFHMILCIRTTQETLANLKPNVMQRPWMPNNPEWYQHSALFSTEYSTLN